MAVNSYIKQMFAALVSIGMLTGVIIFSGPMETIAYLKRFPVWIYFFVFLLLTCNLQLVAFRMWRMLSHFDYSLPWLVTLRANIFGQAASQWFISLFSQVVGRQVVLGSYGVTPAASAIMSAYERIIQLVINGSFAFVGAVSLWGWQSIRGVADNVNAIQIFAVILSVLAVKILWNRTTFEKRLADNLNLSSAIRKLLELSLLTVVGQLTILSVFVALIAISNPALGFWVMFSAAAIISFAASMPVSVNGWGVREIAAIYVLGEVGIPSAQALSISIAVGFCSTLVVFMALPFVSKNWFLNKAIPLVKSKESRFVSGSLEKAAVWILAMLSAILVFFQTYIPISKTNQFLNVNLADPLAFLALAAVVMQSFHLGKFPEWRLNSINKILLVITLLLVFAFLNGLPLIGVTQWALTGRLIGWAVLLGYFAIGYLVVSQFGLHGLRKMTEMLVTTAVVVVLVQIALRALATSEFFQNIRLPLYFEGYSMNRNAFAFQLSICLVMLFVYSKSLDRNLLKVSLGSRMRAHMATSAMAVLLLGVALTSSRAGYLTTIILLSVVWFLKLASKRIVISALCAAFLLWLVISGKSSAQSLVHIQSEFSGEGSNLERWQLISLGIQLWEKFPIFGSGLGVFIAKSTDWFPAPTPIHNTAVWILVEFGVAGVVVFAWVIYKLINDVNSRFRFQTRWMYWLLLIAFALFSMAHEIFYQRLFWLTIGALLAVPIGIKKLEYAEK